MTAPNAELAYKILDHIDANPAQWKQREWWCGTGGCFAGWAAVLSGGEPILDESGDWVVVTKDGQQHIKNAALVALGIKTEYFRTGEPCRCGCGERFEEMLFDGFNTREDLGRMVEEIFGPRPAVAA